MAMSDEVKQPPYIIDGVTIHAAHKHWAMGELGPCVIVIWRGMVTEEAFLHIKQ